MRALRRGLTVAAVVGLLVSLLPSHVTAAEKRWAPPTGGCWTVKPEERGFAERINVARRIAGRSTLRLDDQLSRSARKHTWEMVRANSLHHTPSTTLRRRVTNWVVLGENVGVGSEVDTLHRAFMDSPLHRDNVLYSTFRHVGVGTVRRDGRLWVTVLFEAETNPGTTLMMPACG
ncbi:MAG: CAP domain-containing protein [Actinomycetota bacterium]|nr:CAP domain-containing protein [Actinomycetota bacterium]